ncbi:HAD family hydrolase [Actinomadura litoris]|uniref:HAD-IA family hydrolase n=1 Tax=Actinomadura litoris TaxID=2678616 RepID=A0A7K1KZ35_9ACTN|nr:HAD family phosphatase [Actinomadura litoris]MUN37303.1 HAD-IA family hydrolase [Actinomadura litoris]
MAWVVFDYGEVICHRPPGDSADRLPRALAADPAAFWDAYWDGREPYDRGAVDAAGYWDGLCEHLTAAGHTGHPARVTGTGTGDGDGLLHTLVGLDIDMWSHLNPGTLTVLDDLAARDVPLALLSNAPRELARDIDGRPWSARFRRRFYSADLNLTKPDPRIYRHVADALAVPPAELVFVDDRQVNVDAARDAGLRAHLYTGTAALRRDLDLPATTAR